MSMCSCNYLLGGFLLGVPTLYIIWYVILLESQKQIRLYFEHFIHRPIRRYFQGGQYTKQNRIDDKVAIVTGANSGIGLETALDLAKRGARVYLACRNVAAGQTVCLRIIKETGNANVFVLKLDLGSLETVRDFVKAYVNMLLCNFRYVQCDLCLQI